MCTSIVSHRKKAIIGWNLDIPDIEYKMIAEDIIPFVLGILTLRGNKE